MIPKHLYAILPDRETRRCDIPGWYTDGAQAALLGNAVAPDDIAVRPLSVNFDKWTTAATEVMHENTAERVERVEGVYETRLCHVCDGTKTKTCSDCGGSCGCNCDRCDGEGTYEKAIKETVHGKIVLECGVNRIAIDPRFWPMLAWCDELRRVPDATIDHPVVGFKDDKPVALVMGVRE